MTPAGAASSSSRRRRIVSLTLVTLGALGVILLVVGSKGMLGRHHHHSDAKATSSVHSGVTTESVPGGSPDSPTATSSAPTLEAVASGATDQGSGSAPTDEDTKGESGSGSGDTESSPAGAQTKGGSGSGDTEGEDDETALVEGDTCFAEDAGELRDAVERQVCSTVILTGTDEYDMDKEIKVTRAVIVQGSPTTMPVLSAEEGTRVFRVKTGGHLTVRYVQMKPADGLLNPDYDFDRELQAGSGSGEGRPENYVFRDVRGGCVLFESDAIGGLFVGVLFLETDPIEEMIQIQLHQTKVRIYGEMVLMFGGEVDFVNCIFYDLAPFLPVVDWLYLGGWVLMFDGVMTFTGCTFFEINGFGMEAGIGLNFWVAGGALVMNFCNFMETNLATAMIAVGEAFLVSGGAAVYTGVAFEEWSAILFMVDTGPFAVIGGVQVSTGVFNAEAIGIGAEFGAGMEWAVGAGASINIGTTMLEIYNIFVQATAGEITFLGAGTYIGIGSPIIEFANVVSENGAGGFGYIGAGVAAFVGCPLVETVAVGSAIGIGEFFAQSAGLMVWTDAVWVEFVCAEFLNMLGAGIFVGAGAFYIKNNPIIEWFVPGLTYIPLNIEFWVNGGCEAADGTRRRNLEGAAPYDDDDDDYDVNTPRDVAIAVWPNNTAPPLVPFLGAEYHSPIFISYLTGCDKYISNIFSPDFRKKPVVVDDGTDWFTGAHEDDDAWVKDKYLSEGGNAGGVYSSDRELDGVQAEGTQRASSTLDGAVSDKSDTESVAARQQQGEAYTVEHGAEVGLRAPTPKRKMSENERLIRRHMTALPTMANFESLDPGKLGLTIEGVSKKTGTPDDIQSLNIPDDWKTALAKVQASMQALNTNLGGKPAPTDTSTDLNVFINNPLDGMCYLCEVDASVMGDGAKYCAKQETCSSAFEPSSALLPPPVSETQDRKINFTPHIMTIVSVSPTTAQGVTLTPMSLQEAAVDALHEVQSSHENKSSIIVHGFPGIPSAPPSVTEALRLPNETAPSAFQTDIFNTTQSFRLALIATDQNTSNAIAALINADQDGNEAQGGLSDLIKDSLLRQQGVQVGHLGLQQVWSISIPAYDKLSMAQANLMKTLGSRSVMLVDPTQRSVPVSTVHYNRKYVVHLAQFPPNAQIRVQQLKHTSWGDVPTSITVLTTTTDADGVAEVAFQFKDSDSKPAIYLFKAISLLDASYGESPLYTLSTQRYQRRLYGASVWI